MAFERKQCKQLSSVTCVVLSLPLAAYPGQLLPSVRFSYSSHKSLHRLAAHQACNMPGVTHT